MIIIDVEPRGKQNKLMKWAFLYLNDALNKRDDKYFLSS